MSNVLIGIIGVILFIGLALAGALFLGPRFQESTNNSRASAAVQAVAQVSSAANMFRVQEGRGAADADALVTADYLKSLPSNPTSGNGAGLPALTGDANTTVGRRVEMTLGDNGGAVCEAINKQSGQADVIDAPTGTQGCYVDDLTTPTTWTAYSTI